MRKVRTWSGRQGPTGGRRRVSRRAVVLVALAAVLASCGGSDVDTEVAVDGSPASIGSVIDASVLTGEATTVSGEVFDLATLTDQDLVLWFWAPW